MAKKCLKMIFKVVFEAFWQKLKKIDSQRSRALAAIYASKDPNNLPQAILIFN
jgi:hypothetical protein